MTSRATICFAIFFLAVGVSVADDNPPAIDFPSLSDEQLQSASKYGYPYTLEQARKFGYTVEETDQRRLSDLSDEELRTMAFNGDSLAQHVFMRHRLLAGGRLDEAVAVAMEGAARYGHTDLLNLLAYAQLDISVSNAFVYYALAARLGDPDSIQMRHDLAVHLGDESSNKGLKKMELLYENLEKRRRQLGID